MRGKLSRLKFSTAPRLYSRGRLARTPGASISKQLQHRGRLTPGRINIYCRSQFFQFIALPGIDCTVQCRFRSDQQITVSGHRLIPIGRHCRSRRQGRFCAVNGPRGYTWKLYPRPHKYENKNHSNKPTSPSACTHSLSLPHSLSMVQWSVGRSDNSSPKTPHLTRPGQQPTTMVSMIRNGPKDIQTKTHFPQPSRLLPLFPPVLPTRLL